jgi:hypothetical protein
VTSETKFLTHHREMSKTPIFSFPSQPPITTITQQLTGSLPVPAVVVATTGVVSATTPAQGHTDENLASLNEFLSTSGTVAKSEVVRSGFRFLTETRHLSREDAFTTIAKKIKVRSTKAVRYYLKDGSPEDKPHNGPGRPPVISGTMFEELKEWIASEYASARYVTIDDILDWVTPEDSEDSPNVNTLRHTLREANFRPVRAITQEPGRIKLTTNQIDWHFRALAGLIERYPARLVINADESGFQPWTDSKDVKVWVPDTHHGDTAQVPVERQSKRITLLAGITLSGAVIRPLVIIPRMSFELELAATGYTDYALFSASAKGMSAGTGLEYGYRTRLLLILLKFGVKLAVQMPALFSSLMAAVHMMGLMQYARRSKSICS